MEDDGVPEEQETPRSNGTLRDVEAAPSPAPTEQTRHQPIEIKTPPRRGRVVSRHEIQDKCPSGTTPESQLFTFVAGDHSPSDASLAEAKRLSQEQA
eukprot:6536760-Pyramimonas_sp.AAC.1